MKQILITGLDGSGKSTVFDVLEKIKSTRNIETIRLPHIDTENIKDNPSLKNAAIFVNEINQMADLENKVPLKAVAIFLSMRPH